MALKEGFEALFERLGQKQPLILSLWKYNK